ncbi:MAG TPA: radical SAM protein [Phycisphaerae bacterium]|nr:radical SAM protein [Phycisphaerae bacterium]HUT60925.1 radical SAM protein [Phycisphaerae bacterium]
MRLLLVTPTGLQVGYDGYFSSSPLGIETLAAHARDYADVALADMRGMGHDVEAHAEQLLKDTPDIVGISVNSAPHTKYSLALAGAIRRRRADLRIIAGGQHATFIVEELLRPGDFDAVIRGEGEQPLCEVLSSGEFRGVAGVSWRDDGAIRNEPDRPLIEDLDTVLPPARDLLPDRSRYRMGAYRVEGIESSRGCPFRCSFCSIRNFHRGRWRPKSVARVMMEVDSILERYPERKVIYFADDNFCTDIRRVEAICRAIAERRTDAYFWCQARVDTLVRHPELVEWMGKAHFAAVLTGLETPVPRLLKQSGKGTTVDQAFQAIELLHAHDIGVWGTFTLGLPGETHEEAEQTGRFIAKSNVDIAQITVATPIPGSDLYTEAVKSDSLLHSDWDCFDFTSPTMAGQLSKKDMDAIMHRAYLKVYLGWRFIRSLFTQRTNVSRVRRTALGVFWSWIAYLIKERVSSWIGRKQKMHAPQGSAK